MTDFDPNATPRKRPFSLQLDLEKFIITLGIDTKIKNKC